MQVRLAAEMFRTDAYDLRISGGGLAFMRGEQTAFCVPFAEIRSFCTDGNGGSRHFVLETPSRVYEGFFVCAADAEAFIAALRRRNGCRLSISFD